MSVLLAAALTGPSEWLHRRFRLPLGVAAVLIYLVSFAILVGIGGLVVPPLLGEVVEFADRAPEYADRYGGVRDAYAELRPTSPCCRRSRSRCRGSATRSSTWRASALRRFPATFSIFVDLLAAFFISLLLLTSRMRIRGFILSLTHPDYRRRTGLVLDRIWLRIGHYLWAKAIVMTIVGVLTYISLIAIGCLSRSRSL